MRRFPQNKKKKKKMVQNVLRSKMEKIISGITGQPVEVAVLGKGQIYLSIVMDGYQAVACSKLQQFFGAKFDAWEYDKELDATYAGIKLES